MITAVYPLIGARSAQDMELITVHHENIASVAVMHEHNTDSPQTFGQSKDEVCTEFDDVFTTLGRECMPGKVKLDVDRDVASNIMPPRRVPLAVRPKLKCELDRLEALGVIVKVTEPTDWVSSLLAVQKTKGIRLCIDPQPLNKALKRRHYPLPTIDDILPELANVKVFSKTDLCEGFLQCELDYESSLLTTFQSPWGRYRYLPDAIWHKPRPRDLSTKAGSMTRKSSRNLYYS